MFGNEKLDGLTQVKFAMKINCIELILGPIYDSCSDQTKTSGNRGRHVGFKYRCVWSAQCLGGSPVACEP